MKLKRIILVVLIIVVGFGTAYAATRLDVKTKIKEKTNMTGIKHSAIYFLEKAGYKIVEIKEDYTVWLVNFSETRKDPDQYTVKLTVMISPPSLFRKKAPIAQKEIEVKYTYNPQTINVDDTGFLGFIKKKVKTIKDKQKVRGFFVGGKVAKVVKLLLLEAKREVAEKPI